MHCQLTKDRRKIEMPPLAFVANAQSSVRSGSDRNSRGAIDREADIGTWLLDRDCTAEALAQREAVTNLRNASEKARGRSLKLDNVRPRVRIHEDGIGLANQNVVK